MNLNLAKTWTVKLKFIIMISYFVDSLKVDNSMEVCSRMLSDIYVLGWGKP